MTAAELVDLYGKQLIGKMIKLKFLIKHYELFKQRRAEKKRKERESMIQCLKTVKAFLKECEDNKWLNY